MTFGLLELLAAALILVALLIWWMWPRRDHDDLAAPPPNMRTGVDVPAADERPSLSPPDHSPLTADDLSPAAKRGTVRHESDYSEEDLMMRDVRAALHRGSVSEAVKRIQRTRNISEEEALDFLETVDLPK